MNTEQKKRIEEIKTEIKQKNKLLEELNEKIAPKKKELLDLIKVKNRLTEDISGFEKRLMNVYEEIINAEISADIDADEYKMYNTISTWPGKPEKEEKKNEDAINEILNRIYNNEKILEKKLKNILKDWPIK